MNPLFKTELDRAEILALNPDLNLDLAEPVQAISVNVFRNHSFELVASVLPAFLSLSQIAANFTYSDYDDSLSAMPQAPKADLHLIWLDALKYRQSADFLPWLAEHVANFRKSVSGAVVLACLGLDAQTLLELPGVLNWDLDAFLAEQPGKPFDPRLEPLTGTRLSNQSCLQIARELGAHVFPCLFQPALKAVVLDLDNTLYQGVLGEDGPANLVPNLELQTFCANLAKQGFLLAVASKNEERDVKELFAQRLDFPLRWDNFAAHEINWDSKAANIVKIAKKFNIGLDSMVFVDDNPGELYQVARKLPEVKLVEAADPHQALAALKYLPGLYKSALSLEDLLRQADIEANAQRQALLKQACPTDYFADLRLVLTFACNPTQHAQRITELLNKTNQFILNYLRPTADQIADWLDHPQKCVITASMADRLSDSGLIAVVLASKHETIVRIDELVVSCRALGRGVEDDMLKQMLNLAWARLADETPLTMTLPYQSGPRNQPGLNWLKNLGAVLAKTGEVQLTQQPVAKLHNVQVREL